MFSSKSLSADHRLNCVCDKSFADDLVSSRCCKYESNLCITIYWGFCGVSSICSSLVLLLEVVLVCVFITGALPACVLHAGRAPFFFLVSKLGLSFLMEAGRLWLYVMWRGTLYITVAILAQGTTSIWHNVDPFFMSTSKVTRLMYRFLSC